MKILIVDDDPLVGQSLQLLLNKEKDLTVIGNVTNGQEAIDFCKEKTPDLILMDIQMPVLNGIESTKIIKRTYPIIQIMMLTTFKDARNIRLALKAGAEGYLIKSNSIEKMAEQIRALQSGATVLTPDVLQTLMQQGKKGLEQLTDREVEITTLVGEGLSNKEIAKQLYLGEGTIRNVISTILDKLEIRDRTQLAIFYWQKKHNDT
ncbi:response regulator transcription factor [Alkalihalobacillus pseudalcaliphilus]|uniref:response regulator transcription factor n=1 Tax=Alkalihalobacillus pseudalcaliphilus TaxID=79884 RepID=UPI00064D8C93|nr:response regulator transcription factor [Alkalihalobacillus pseudalcaliphilus]KMK77927.1 LuxR family transcriptional regulator [Alkalihalobacillus pseudalcaliphilus]